MVFLNFSSKNNAAKSTAKPVPPPANPETKAQPQGQKPEAKRGYAHRYTELKMTLHQKLLDMINLSAIEKMTPELFRREVGEMVHELLAAESTPLNTAERTQLVNDVLDEVVGLGPIEPLLKDDSVSDILINSHSQVFVERFGKLEATPVHFKDTRHVLRIIDKIVSAVGRRVDESQPMVDARLADGSRFNAIIPPLAVDGPLVSIRKFAREKIDLDRLVAYGSMTDQIAELLVGIVQCRRNVLISGGTGSGKTTMLNAISSSIDGRERIITIEDAAELQLQQTHVARLETRPPNVEGKGEIPQRDLLKNALRMRPDRIIIGECRGSEAFDMLQAMNTGHDGSMTTIHANTPRDALSRLEQMVGMMGIDMPQRSIRSQISAAIHVILQLERMSDGRRRLISLSEITGMEGEVVTLQEIFSFRRTGMDAEGNVLGYYQASGVRPKFMSDLQARGVEISDNLFEPTTAHTAPDARRHE